jgi:hypothetical protein
VYRSVAASVTQVVYILIKSSFLHSRLFEKLARIAAHGTMTIATGYTAGLMVTVWFFNASVFGRIGKFMCLPDSDLAGNMPVLLL